ncbi:hypothetical protein BH09MYX1_BH09MYX1_62820 [soil metagenome]
MPVDNGPVPSPSAGETSNSDQANCNERTEARWNATPMGDVCDPVPCPASTPEVTTSTSGGCTGNPQTGGACWGRRIRGRLDTLPIKAHFLDSPKADSGLVPPEAIPTHFRFCQSNTGLLFNCRADDVVDDDQLAYTDASMNPARPWHRVSFGSDALATSYPGAYGAGSSFDRTSGFLRSLTWNYVANASAWQGTIPAPGGYPNCTNTGTYGTGTCLSGTMWSHADTAIGGSIGIVDGVNVGIHGIKLANHYEDFRPDDTYSWSYRGKGIVRRILLWKTLPDPWRAWNQPHTGVLVSGTDGMYAGVLRDDGTRAVLTDEASGGPATGKILDLLKDTDLVWARRVESRATLGGVDPRLVSGSAVGGRHVSEGDRGGRRRGAPRGQRDRLSKLHPKRERRAPKRTYRL